MNTAIKSMKCKRSGIIFDAPNKRYKQHPVISRWLAKANQEGWYAKCVEAIEDLKGKAETIEEFDIELHLVRSAAINSIQQTEKEQNDYWATVKESAKTRRRQNEMLKKAGYRWVNLAYTPDDPDLADWQLFAPNGVKVSFENAMNQISGNF